MPSRTVALWCWYHGAAFRGYQSQPQGPTVQDTVKSALRAAGFDRNPAPSSRTDKGVHARMQVLSLRVPRQTPAEEVAPRLAPHLPEVMGVLLSRDTRPRFHAAWSSSGKDYRYRLALEDVAAWRALSWRVDVRPERVAEVLARAVGTRDFFAFHHKSSAVKPRTLRATSVAEVEPGVVELRIRGDGFARYMVRRLVGAAVDVARGELALEAYLAALDEARPIPESRAPAAGLVLWEVLYPPDADPFTAEERQAPRGLPGAPPFVGG